MRRLSALLIVAATACSSGPADSVPSLTTPSKTTTTTTTTIQIQSGPFPLAELVAEQVETGDTDCPEDSEVTHEACLLFQGALYARGGDLTDLESIRTAPGDADFQNQYAIALARTVPILSSTDNYGFQTAVLGDEFEAPGSDAEVCLQVRHGICGNQSAVALALFEEAGMLAQPAAFYYLDPVTRRRNAHVAVEVYIDGAWRYVDTTYGTYWPTEDGLATLDEILVMDDPRSSAVQMKALLPKLDLTVVNHPAFEYLEVEADVIRGRIGTIHLDDPTEDFANIPGHVGDNQADGRSASGMTFEIAVPSDGVLVVETVAAGGSDNASLCLDDVCLPIEMAPATFEFPASGPRALLRVRTTEDTAYVVLKSLSWRS